MTDEPLKPLPCPFCGSGSEDLYCDGHYVHCEVCNTTGPSVYPVLDDDAAIAAWNRRVEPIGNSDELQSIIGMRIEELEELICELKNWRKFIRDDICIGIRV